LREATTWNDQLLAWGEMGLIAPTGRANPGPTRITAASSLDVAPSDLYLYVLTDRYVEVRDRRLRLVGKVDAAGFSHLAVTGKRLVAVGEHGGVVFDLATPVAPRLAGVLEGGVSRV